MPQFIMDKCGAVVAPDATGFAAKEGVTLWKDLDAFTQGYIEAMFFTEEREHVDGEDLEETGAIPHNSCFGMIAPEGLAAIVAFCRRFQDEHAALLAQAYELEASGTAYTDERAGADLWFTSQGHGVGFWDRGLGDVGDELSKQCGYDTSFPEQYVEADDSVIYIR